MLNNALAGMLTWNACTFGRRVARRSVDMIVIRLEKRCMFGKGIKVLAAQHQSRVTGDVEVSHAKKMAGPSTSQPPNWPYKIGHIKNTGRYNC